MAQLQSIAAIMLVALAIGGCGLDPGADSTSRTRATPASTRATRGVSAATTRGGAGALAEAQRTHEYPTPAPRQRVVGGWRTPVQAVQVFATTYINWDADTVAPRLRALAEVSVGQARSAMSLAASQTARDYELRNGGIANSGVVEAIGLVLDHPDEYAVVTRERTTASHTGAYQGLAPAWHVALATVTRVQGGLWVLSAWQPEN